MNPSPLVHPKTGRSRAANESEGASETQLAQSIRALASAHPGQSGAVLLPDGHEAFAARRLLANTAARTLDIQYYIWHNDRSGTLLFEALWRAADRGVRVRLLLDDINTKGLDPLLAALQAHPHIEIRLFNPFKFRRWRTLNYLTDFARLNRRMHNKSFTADNQATILGGRNVGDAYFGANQDVLFVDLDVLAIGPVASEVSQDFERYWTCASSHSAACILPQASLTTIATVMDTLSHSVQNPATPADSPLVEKLVTGQLPFEWAPIRVLSDDPAKGLGRAANQVYVWQQLKLIMGAATRDLRLISSYFVPTRSGAKLLAILARHGVNTMILTNSLAATDVPAVHAGYAKRRQALLKAGVRLFELKRTSPKQPVKGRRLAGSSNSSLHTKTFAVDGERVYIGSFNFDPRSARLNTEMGFVIESPTLAKTIAEKFAGSLPARAYKVQLSDGGKLRWVEQLEGKEVVHTQEPGTSFWRRLGVSLLSLLPIDWLL